MPLPNEKKPGAGKAARNIGGGTALATGTYPFVDMVVQVLRDFSVQYAWNVPDSLFKLIGAMLAMVIGAGGLTVLNKVIYRK